MNRLAVIAIAALALHGCGGKSRQPAPAIASVPAEPVAEAPPAAAATAPTDPVAKAPTPTPAELERLMARTAAMIEAMADAATKSGDDCGRAAAAVEQVMVDNRAFLAEAARYKDNPEVARMAAEWMDAHKPALIGPVSIAARMSERCATDPAFKAVVEKYGGL